MFSVGKLLITTHNYVRKRTGRILLYIGKSLIRNYLACIRRSFFRICHICITYWHFTNFTKMWAQFQNSRRQKGDMKQVPKTIRRNVQKDWPNIVVYWEKFNSKLSCLYQEKLLQNMSHLHYVLALYKFYKNVGAISKFQAPER